VRQTDRQMQIKT